MSLLEDVFSLTKEEQIALLDELEKKASVASPIALPQEVIETFELPDEVDIEEELAKIKEIILAEIQSVTINAPKGDKGNKGDKGDKGDIGPRGLDGKDGKQGKEGKDGVDGENGISVTDARVDFDGSLVITLSNGQEINAGDVIPNDKKDLIIQSLKNSTLSLTELGIEDFLSSPTPIGDVTPNTGAFTDLTDTSLTSGRVTYATTGGNLTDSANLTFNGTTLTTTAVTTPSVTATTNNLTLSAISTGNINLNTPNGTALKVLPVGAVSSNWLQVGNPATTVIRLGPAGTTVADFRILTPTFTNFYTGSSADGLSDGSAQMRVSHTASAVNYVQVTGSATGSSPLISAQGSDADIGLRLTSKGSFDVGFFSSNNTFRQFAVSGGQAAVNYFQVAGSASTKAPIFSALGTDTNIPLAFISKGTGAIDLAAGSSGVNISNGGTVTAITRTANGTGYTSFPTVNITAPTTAGGVQAVATVTNMQSIGASISAGGTGYTVGNVITITGGTPVTVAATFTVSAVSSGVVTAVTALNFAPYTVLPTAPVSTTGGSGTGLTLTALTWAIGSSFTISNAGSGYIEQPTITFSGGGGSGATAFATIGSNTSIKTHGNYASFFASNSGSESLRLYGNDSGAGQYQQATGPGFVIIPAQSGYGATRIGNQQSFHQLEIGSAFNTAGSIAIQFNTAVAYGPTSGSITSGNRQFAIAHTASAANYVQVTGAATGSGPTISAQGSDTNVNMTLRSKGTGYIGFTSGAGSGILLGLPNGSANYFTVASSNASSAPILAVAGSDTNIDLTLTPKGTGLVRFGTYVAGALTATGYINIKAADGTTYKVLVST